MEKSVEIRKRKFVKWNLDSEDVLIREKGVQEIEVTKITRTLNNGRKVCEEHSKILKCYDVEIFEIPIRPVTVEEIVELRNSGKPGFLLKKDDKLFYNEIGKDGKELVKGLFKETHKCNEHCTHVSAASDECGGCEKVRNKATYIERYDWIKLGCEIFNVLDEMMYVAKCEHYERSQQPLGRKNELNTRERINYRQSLRSFFYS